MLRAAARSVVRQSPSHHLRGSVLGLRTTRSPRLGSCDAMRQALPESSSFSTVPTNHSLTSAINGDNNSSSSRNNNNNKAVRADKNRKQNLRYPTPQQNRRYPPVPTNHSPTSAINGVNNNSYRNNNKAVPADNNSKQNLRHLTPLLNRRIDELGNAKHNDALLEFCCKNDLAFDSTSYIRALFHLVRNGHQGRNDLRVEQILQGAADAMENQAMSLSSSPPTSSPRFLEWLKPNSLSRFLSSLVGLGLSPQSNQSVERIVRLLNEPKVATAVVQNSSPMCLSKIVWAAVKLRPTLNGNPGHFLETAEQQVTWMFQNGSNREVSNFVWALGERGVPHCLGVLKQPPRQVT